MGIPGEDRWAGRRFPCIQVLQPPVHMGCDAQCTCALLYTRYPTHSCGGSTACVTTIQLHPLTLDCFCCSLAKAHLSMPATEDRQLTINQFFGFPLVGRSTASLYTIWSRCKYTIAADTQQIRDHTHAQRPMLNMTTDRCGAAEKSTQYQWSRVRAICRSFGAVPKPICSSS